MVACVQNTTRQLLHIGQEQNKTISWSNPRHFLSVSKNLLLLLLLMFPSRSAIANGYGEVYAVIPLACKITIAFLAMLLSSCSLFLPSEVIHDPTEKVANLRERFLRFRAPVCGSKMYSSTTWSYAPFQFCQCLAGLKQILNLLVFWQDRHCYRESDVLACLVKKCVCLLVFH